MNSTELSGQTALVTGSTKLGIGAATAALLASRGASVIVTGRDKDGGEQVVKDIVAAGGTARFVRASFDAAFAVNVRALYFLTAAVVPGMVARGRGSVVNVSTMAASVGMAGLSTYSATKAAVESLTRTWAVELGGAGVRVNAVAPRSDLSEGLTASRTASTSPRRSARTRSAARARAKAPW